MNTAVGPELPGFIFAIGEQVARSARRPAADAVESGWLSGKPDGGALLAFGSLAARVAPLGVFHL